MNLASTINQMKRIMKYQAENTVSSFFYYMWNAWSEEERKAVYGGMYPHFWEKWCVATDKGTFGAAERFYLELSEDNRRILVERAVSIYDGRHFRKRNSNPKNQTVCEETYQSDRQLMRLQSNGSTGVPGLRNPVSARIAGGR
jgi:hypothetical protein